MNFKDMWQEYEDRQMEREWKGPDKIGNGISKHVKRNAWLTAFAVIAIGAISYVCIMWWPDLFSEDKDALIRWSVQKTQHVSIFGIGLTSWIWFMDWMTNGNFMGTILREPRACAQFLGLLAIAWAWVFVTV